MIQFCSVINLLLKNLIFFVLTWRSNMWAKLITLGIETDMLKISFDWQLIHHIAVKLNLNSLYGTLIISNWLKLRYFDSNNEFGNIGLKRIGYWSIRAWEQEVLIRIQKFSSRRLYCTDHVGCCVSCWFQPFGCETIRKNWFWIRQNCFLIIR